VAALGLDVRPIYDRFAVSPYPLLFTWDRGAESARKPVWIIGRDGARVLGYDEVEEEYGIGRLDAGEVLGEWRMCGNELRFCLMQFSDPDAGIPLLGPARPLDAP